MITVMIDINVTWRSEYDTGHLSCTNQDCQVPEYEDYCYTMTSKQGILSSTTVALH